MHVLASQADWRPKVDQKLYPQLLVVFWLQLPLVGLQAAAENNTACLMPFANRMQPFVPFVAIALNLNSGHQLGSLCYAGFVLSCATMGLYAFPWQHGDVTISMWRLIMHHCTAEHTMLDLCTCVQHELLHALYSTTPTTASGLIMKPQEQTETPLLPLSVLHSLSTLAAVYC
jgi:hypothetical protein